MHTEHSQPSLPLSGLWLPLVTPFADGQLDRASVARLVDHTLGQPVDGLIVAATTGEGLTLEEGEEEALVSITAQTVNRRVPLFLGLAGSDTARLAAFVETTASWPVDGYLVSCPHYSRPSQQGLLQHFTAVAAATDRPLVFYNIPYRTGVNLLNDTLLGLAALPNIVGLKDCCRDAAQTHDLLRRKPAAFSVLTGEDAQYYSALVHGAEGAILASAHVETARFAAVRQLLLAGDQPGALRQWNAISGLVDLLFAEPSPGAVKHWLWRQGLIASPELRLPMTMVSPALADRLDQAMKTVGAGPAGG